MGRMDGELTGWVTMGRIVGEKGGNGEKRGGGGGGWRGRRVMGEEMAVERQKRLQGMIVILTVGGRVLVR